MNSNTPNNELLQNFFTSLTERNTAMLQQIVNNMSKLHLPDDQMAPFTKLWGSLAEQSSSWLAVQQSFYQQQMNMWMSFLGKPAEGEEGAPADKRFAAPEWNEHPYYKFLKQNYLLTSKWLTEMVDGAQVDEEQKERMAFFTQIGRAHV